jgi:hypothetical protein
MSGTPNPRRPGSPERPPFASRWVARGARSACFVRFVQFVRFVRHMRRSTGCAGFAAHRTVPAVVAAGLIAAGSAGAAGPDFFTYQIELPPPPVNAAEAATGYDQRATQVLAALACGSELQYATSQSEAGADSTALLVVKLAWLIGPTDTAAADPTRPPPPRPAAKDCAYTRYVRPDDLCKLLVSPITCTASALLSFGLYGEAFRQRYFPWTECLSSTLAMSRPQPSFTLGGATRPLAAEDPEALRVDFAVTPACLAKQINMSLERMTVVEQMGTHGSPCRVFGTSGGDWDMSVINLTRLAYLERRHSERTGIRIVQAAALANLREHLMSADGGPADEKYALTGCGNTEESSGSAQERADERDWTDEPFWQSVGDLLKFLFKLVLVIAIAFLIGLALVTLFGPFLAGVLVAAGAVAAATLLFVDLIPETENHLLMINTSKYLHNQLIIEDVPDANGSNRFRKDQRALKDWLLAKMQNVMQHEFVEYNSRPYNRLSTFAIQNLADYANDDELRLGARIVLDHAGAKFAVGNQQGRRFLPFRRKREAMAAFVDVDAPNSNGLFDLIQAGDHQIGLGLLYTGQTGQLRDRYASFGMAGQAIFAATSAYRPEPLVVDLALGNGGPLFQRMHHTTGEVYSRGQSFLIAAGGTTSGLAYSATGSEAADLLVKPGLKDDLGLAMPTTLFLAASPLDEPGDRRKRGVGRTTLDELIRIDGTRPDRPEPYPSYDQNLCVWVGFACGVNIVVPDRDGADPLTGFPAVNQLLGEAGPCRSAGPDGSAPEWNFIDARRCPAYRNAPRFFIAVYRQACPALQRTCKDNFGFFEVVDATAADDFEAWKRRVVAANPPGFVTSGLSLFGSGMTGTYHSARGQAIEFQADAAGGRNAGIVAVDGIAQHDLGDWAFAEGAAPLPAGTQTPITSSGDGFVAIRNPRTQQTLQLDFRDAAHPKRSIK